MRNALLAALAATALAASPARAQVSHFVTQGVEIDGNYLDDVAPPGRDWFPDLPPFTDPIAQDDETLCGTSPAPKNDLTNTFVANDFDYLYMGMERLANHGNTSFFFSFDITGDGPSFGDFVFVFCFGSGSRVTDSYVLEWDPVLREFRPDSTPPAVDFAVNEVRVLAPFGALDRHGRPSTVIDPGKVGEARVRLADIEGFDVCDADDVTLEIQTKSSCSLSSQCKDTSGAIHFSFTPLTADLAVSQAPGCAPEIVATAHAVSPRPGSVTYRWFLDGVEITGDDPTWAASDSIAIPLESQCGPVTVAVIADDGTCHVEDEADVDVNREPVASLGSPSVDACSGVLAFDGSASADCNGTALAFAWDFDSNGSVDSTAPSGTFAFAGCGERTVTLRVGDGECLSPPASLGVYVNAPPEAGIAIRASAAHCLEIAFDVTSTDCDLSETSGLYTESLATTTDFGDGTAAVTDISGVHRYEACGSYVVTTTTTDASGCSSTVSRTVDVGVVAEVE